MSKKRPYCRPLNAGLMAQAKLPDREALELVYFHNLARIARVVAQALADEMADK